MENRIPKGFIGRCSWAACLFILYGLLIVASSAKLAPVFIPLGASATVSRLYRLWTRRQKSFEPDFRSGVPFMAADLVFLVVVLHGLLQARIEMDRGNILGAILCLGVVSPLLSLLARAVTIGVGTRLFRI